jgi:YggT family protein
MIDTILTVIDWLFRILSLLLVIDIIIGYFVDPWNPFRRFLDGIFNPLLKPFRKIIPAMGGLDLSPVALMVTFWLIDYIIHFIMNLFR